MIDLPHYFIMILHLVEINALSMLLSGDLLGNCSEKFALLGELSAVLSIE